MTSIFSAPLEQNPGYRAPTDEDMIPTDLAIEKGVTIDNFLDKTVLPPPLIVRTEKIEGEDKPIPGYISQNEKGDMFKKYVEYQGITNDLIESFDRMLMYDLPERLSIIFKDLGDGSYIIADRNSLKVLPPTINVNGVRNLYPSEAHDLERTYGGDMYIKFERRLWTSENVKRAVIGEDHRIPNSSDQVVDRSDYIPIGKIPIMVGSEYCHLSRKRNLSDYDKIRLGNCAYQPNGSFIIKGSDYVVLLEDQTATNKFFIYPKKDAYTSVITTTTNIGSTIIKLSQDKDNVITVSLRFLGSSGKKAKDKKSINVIRVIRLLLKRIIPGYSPTFDYIWKLMEQYINPKALSQTKTLFKKTFLASFKNLEGKLVSAWGDNDDDEFLFNSLEERRNNQAKGKRIKKDIEEKVYRHLSEEEKEQEKMQGRMEREKMKEEWKQTNFIELINDLFPQMPREDLSGKLNMLLLMISRFLEFLTGYRKADNQDDWSNKKLINAGPAILKIFIWWYKKYLNKYIPDISQAGPTTSFVTIDGRRLNLFDMNIKSIVAAVSNMEGKVTEHFERSFTYNWGDQKNVKPIKKTDILKNANIIDMLSHMLRIASQVDDRSTSMAPRMVSYYQYGFIDPADTPEGGTCGLVRNKAVSAIVTVDRDDTVIYIYLKQTNRLNNIKTGVNNTICLLNSKFVGWCDGQDTLSYLKSLKQSFYISYDTTIVLERIGVPVLFILTDGGRLIRPFFVVDKQNQISDKKNQLVMDTHNLWDQGNMPYPEYFDSLLRKGAIEYLSPIEQSMTYVAKSTDFLGQKRNTLINYENRLKEFENIEQKIKEENFYTVSGQTEIIISSSEREQAERDEINKIQEQIVEQQERLDRFKNMPTDVFSQISELSADILEKREKIKEFEDEFRTFKLTVTSHEKLKEIIESTDLSEQIRAYAGSLHARQKELLNNLVKNEITILDELVNGEDIEVYNKRNQDLIDSNIERLTENLENLKIKSQELQVDIELFKTENIPPVSSASTASTASTVPTGPTGPTPFAPFPSTATQTPTPTFRDETRNFELIKLETTKANLDADIEKVQQMIETERNRKPKFPRKISRAELELSMNKELDPQRKIILSNRLVERDRMIASSKEKIITLYNELKKLSLDNYILKVKYDIVSFHETELNRRNSLVNEIEKRIEELKKKAAAIKESSVMFEKLSDKSLRETITKTNSLIERIRKELEFSYCEIDPNSMWGISGSIIPFSDRNQSIRNSYVCNQLRQMVGIINTNPTYQMDTTTRSTAYPSRPLIEPQLNKVLGVQDMPIGTNVILAICTYEGANQEDSVIVSKRAVDLGLFRVTKTKTVRIEISPSKTDGEVSIKEQITDVPKNPKRDKDKYQNLVKGIVELGSVVERGDPLVSITRTITENGVSREEDASHYATIGEEGIVDRITPPFDIGGVITIKIRLVQVRDIVEGDKLATLSGQKSTIARIVPVEDMPFGSIYNPKTGKEEMVRPDILMNPHAVPSRMTLELLFEIILGRYAMQAGGRIDATSFKNMDIHHFMNLLPSFGFKSDGTATLYSGKTGQMLESNIMIGPTYYALLKHWVLDKIQAHGNKKKIDPQTRQPVKGRSNEGAIRMGAQERDALFAHGAGKVALERYCISSDRVQVIFCNNCGNLMDLNVNAIDYRCKFCKSNDPIRVKIPYGMVKFIRYMGGAGFKVSFGFLKKQLPESKQ